MPAKSAKQERFMQAVANNPKFAKQVGVPQSVGKEFTKSKGGAMNYGNKMAKGGKMPMTTKNGKKVPAFAADGKGKMAKGGKACGTKKMAKGGMAGKASKRADGAAKKGKTSCKMV
mgnify:CR=1 FL=1